MKSTFRNPFGYGCLYFFLLILGAVLVRDGPFDPSLFARVGDTLQWMDYADPGTYAGAATEIAQFGWVTDKSAWIMNLWPPGFMLLEAGLISLFGVDAPIVLILQTLACAMLAIMLSLQRSLLLRFVSGAVAFVLPLMIFIFPMPRLFLFQPFGAVFGETFSVSFFVSAGLLMLLAAEGRRLWMAVLAGLFFALAAYFRSQYESILMAATGLAIPLVFWCLWRHSRSGKPSDRATYVTIMQVLGIALVVAHAVMLPWRLHSYSVSKNFSWVQTSTLIFQTALRSEKSLMEANGWFFVQGGGDVACRVEPSYCDQTNPQLFFKAFLAHPVEWYSYKLPKIKQFWSTFSEPNGYKFSDWFLAQEAVSYFVYLFMLIATIPLLLLTRAYRWWPLMAWSVASLYAACFVIFSFAHFESRYFYLLKIFTFMWGTNMAAMAWSALKSTQPQAAPRGVAA